ncbi:TVP38/TMEM64 family protein [Arcobacter roscoffensis]|uniref:VTT domain-containing protein n=1 Tax=Arcobacter roscoffensis TaxID=2961520 RepID=A0ABY5E6J6_9BACT|nr:VTT domain-containing protein [Arcobacter roscoffensis]UTJ06338.1 VTT domain-containing protein [Arcobacter roscoffensis]
MKLLIKSVLILFVIFTSMLLIIKFSGLLTVEDIKEIFANLKSQPSYILGSLIVLLLFIDLFIAVPTMTVIILAGYFIGFELAVFYTFIGLFCASFTGYFLSKKYGEKVLDKLSSNETQKLEMKELFNKHGVLVIVLSRAVPLLPEISSCLAGTCKMSFKKFFIAWSIGTIPYLSVITYAGSISNLDNPMPALIAAIGITILFWFLWLVFIKVNKIKTQKC